MTSAKTRNLPLIAILVALMAVPASASAGGQGFNPATRKLEAAFTIVLRDRVSSNTACYASPPKLAALIRKEKGGKTGVSAKGAPRAGVVYVLRKGTNCNKVRMAYREGRDLYLLDSGVGEIRLVGKNRGENTAKLNRGPLRALRLVTKSFQVNSPNRRLRFEAVCPGKTYPMGGGFVATPPSTAGDAEGIYPHSYERLGAQRGWHITAWLFDPTGDGASRSMTVQAVCGKGLVPMSSPHKTTFVRPGETKTVTSRCPGGQVLMSGGFQRTDFLDDGGNYVTESRAVGPNAWRVTGTAYGAYGGELTSLGYCVRSKRPLLTEVSGTAPLPFGMNASATTPPCPGGQRMTAGGFSANGSSATFFGGGSINGDNTWTARGFGFFGSAPVLTAYGYCLQPGR
jgi:hypothetical protein